MRRAVEDLGRSARHVGRVMGVDRTAVAHGVRARPCATVQNGDGGGPVTGLAALPEADQDALSDYAQTGLFRPHATLDEVSQRCRGELVLVSAPWLEATGGDADPAFDPYLNVQFCAKATLWARALIARGITAVAPVAVQAEAIMADLTETVLDPRDLEARAIWARPLLRAAGAVVVAPVSGWERSEYVMAEIRAALQLNKPVFILRGAQT